jgi:hypothetical protein
MHAKGMLMLNYAFVPDGSQNGGDKEFRFPDSSIDPMPVVKML